MNKKSLIIIAICGILVSTLIFGAFSLGNSTGYNRGYTLGYEQGKASNTGTSLRAYQNGNETGYLQGYQAGLQATNNGTG